MVNWILIPIVSIISFIFGGITGAVVACIPFSHALEAMKNGDH